jgi:hypothetical protein
MTQLHYISTYEMKLYLIICLNLYLAFAALSHVKANTATYLCCCVSDLPNKLTGWFEQAGDGGAISFSIGYIPLIH